MSGKNNRTPEFIVPQKESSCALHPRKPPQTLFPSRYDQTSAHCRLKQIYDRPHLTHRKGIQPSNYLTALNSNQGAALSFAATKSSIRSHHEISQNKEDARMLKLKQIRSCIMEMKSQQCWLSEQCRKVKSLMNQIFGFLTQQLMEGLNLQTGSSYLDVSVIQEPHKQMAGIVKSKDKQINLLNSQLDESRMENQRLRSYIKELKQLRQSSSTEYNPNLRDQFASPIIDVQVVRLKNVLEAAEREKSEFLLALDSQNKLLQAERCKLLKMEQKSQYQIKTLKEQIRQLKIENTQMSTQLKKIYQENYEACQKALRRQKSLKTQEQQLRAREASVLKNERKQADRYRKSRNIDNRNSAQVHSKNKRLSPEHRLTQVVSLTKICSDGRQAFNRLYHNRSPEKVEVDARISKIQESLKRELKQLNYLSEH